MKEHDRKVVFSSKSDEYATPNDFFEKLKQEFNFTLDTAASNENHKCSVYYTQEVDGLSLSWNTDGAVFCNPPYSKVAKWIEKGYTESQRTFTTVVMLVPARTDTKWFHEYCMKAAEIRFVKGRLKFGNEKNAAPFPSMVVVFKPGGVSGGPRMRTMERK
jgi:phage N-6-adenine-methyltransferase